MEREVRYFSGWRKPHQPHLSGSTGKRLVIMKGHRSLQNIISQSLLSRVKILSQFLFTKYSDGYYLEDQDYWRLAGIFDDVWLSQHQKLILFDWYATTDLDEAYSDASLSLTVDVKNYSSDAVDGLSIHASVYDQGKTLVREMISEKFQVLQSGKKSVVIKADFKDPAKWSAENPNLYNLSV